MESVINIEKIPVDNQIHIIPLNTNALFQNLVLIGNMVTMVTNFLKANVTKYKYLYSTLERIPLILSLIKIYIFEIATIL